MSATDELRQLLDERGAEWIDFDDEPTWMGNDRMHYARQECSCDEPTDEVTVYHLTPEQAVEATLGRGTCKVVGHGMTVCDDIEFHWYALSCGHRLRTLWAADTIGMYCPECGRRVES